jgi:hypothetical protein
MSLSGSNRSYLIHSHPASSHCPVFSYSANLHAFLLNAGGFRNLCRTIRNLCGNAWHVYQRRVERVLAFVRDEEEGAAVSVAHGGETKGATERESGAVLFKRKTFESTPVAVPTVYTTSRHARRNYNLGWLRVGPGRRI